MPGSVPYPNSRPLLILYLPFSPSFSQSLASFHTYRYHHVIQLVQQQRPLLGQGKGGSSWVDTTDIQTAIVTGGGSGVGKAMAAALAVNGAKVSLGHVLLTNDRSSFAVDAWKP